MSNVKTRPRMLLAPAGRKGDSVSFRFRLVPKGNRQPIPGIDAHDREIKIDQFLLGENPGGFPIDVVGQVMSRDQRDRLDPGKCGSLPVRIFGGLLPGIQKMNLSFSDTELQSVPAMVDNAEGTSIDLGNPQLDKFPKFRFERRFFKMNFNVVKTLQRRAE